MAVPTAAQGVKNLTATAPVRDAGSIPRLRQWVKSSGIAAAVAQVVAVSWIQSLTQALPYTLGAP